MASKYYYFSGKAMWCKNTKPDEEYKTYGLDLYLDAASMVKFKQSGLQLKIKSRENTTPDGQSEWPSGEFISLRRPVSKTIKEDLVELGAPETIIKNDSNQYESFPGNVGNGSSVTCKVLVYDSRKGKGHTLEVIAVDNLVPYSSGIEADEDMPF